MDLTFPLRWRGFRDVADVSLPQGRLRGADELIDSRQDLRAREDEHRVRHSRATHHSLAAAWLPHRLRRDRVAAEARWGRPR